MDGLKSGFYLICYIVCDYLIRFASSRLLKSLLIIYRRFEFWFSCNETLFTSKFYITLGPLLVESRSVLVPTVRPGEAVASPRFGIPMCYARYCSIDMWPSAVGTQPGCGFILPVALLPSFSPPWPSFPVWSPYIGMVFACSASPALSFIASAAPSRLSLVTIFSVLCAVDGFSTVLTPSQFEELNYDRSRYATSGDSGSSWSSKASRSGSSASPKCSSWFGPVASTSL